MQREMRARNSGITTAQAYLTDNGNEEAVFDIHTLGIFGVTMKEKNSENIVPLKQQHCNKLFIFYSYCLLIFVSTKKENIIQKKQLQDKI